MNPLFRLCVCLIVVLLPSCASRRTPFAPESGPPTVGMPAQLSDRERQFVPQIQSALQREGLVPVRDGAGDMQLEFEMSEGPVNADTRIGLNEKGRILANGEGRASGLPLLGRAKVAENSFNSAFQQFDSELRNASSGGAWSAGSAGTPLPYHEEAPVYD